MKKTILIIGGSGLIGKPLVRGYLKDKKVINLDIKNFKLNDKNYNYEKIDLNKLGTIKSKIDNIFKKNININSVINWGKKRNKKGLEIIVDFREKKSNHNNDLEYIQKLIDFARELVISGENYQKAYFRRVENTRGENINYDEYFDYYMVRNPPKLTHYEITFNIEEETFTLRYSNRHYFTDDHGIYWSDHEPHGWPEKLQGNMEEEALKYIDLVQEALNKKKDEINKAINNVVNNGTKGRTTRNISKEIKNYVGGLPWRRRTISKSKGGSKKMRKTKKSNRKTRRVTKKRGRK